MAKRKEDLRKLSTDELIAIINATEQAVSFTQFKAIFERAMWATRLIQTRSIAGYVSQWDKSIDHPYRIEDVINLKFNAVAGKRCRKNPNYRSFYTALKELEVEATLINLVKDTKTGILPVTQRGFDKAIRKARKTLGRG